MEREELLPLPTRQLFKHTIMGLDQPWTLIASEAGISQLLYPVHLELHAQQLIHAHSFDDEFIIEDRSLFVQFGILELLEQYFAGHPVSFDNIPLDVKGTIFQQNVWIGLRQIPYGETWTYKQLAASIEKPAAVRAVGAAVGRNPLPIIIPCHRVIGSNGTLTGFRGGLHMKKDILTLEGITDMKESGHERFRF